MERVDGEWAVRLVGGDWELSELSPHLPGLIRPSRDGDGWEICSPAFEAETDASRVLEIGREVVAIVNAIARLRLDSPSPIVVGNIRRYRPDGTKDAFVFPEPIRLRVRMGTPTILVNGVPAEPESWLPIIDVAGQDATARAVLLFMGQEPTWHSLYAAVETVLKDRRVGGRAGLLHWSDARRQDLQRFTGTANSYAILGTQARHGPIHTPPRDPMTLDEGIRFASRVVEAWIRELGTLLLAEGR